MTSNPSILIAQLFAIGGGIAIGIQSMIISSNGEAVGPVRTAFFVHLGGAIVGAVIIGGLMLRGDDSPASVLDWRVVGIFLVAGLMGMITVPSLAISFPRIGLVAGQVAVITGQMLVAMAADTFGLAGKDPIPVDPQRIIGLILMVIAAYLLLPRN
jgi:bacterial/archaeal transporter family-2 protein